MKRRQVKETTLGMIRGMSIIPLNKVRPLNFSFPSNAQAKPNKYDKATDNMTKRKVMDKEDRKSDFIDRSDLK